MSTTPPAPDAALRGALGTLVERWQQQLHEYEQRATANPRDGRYARYASLRATRLRSCIREVQVVLDTGHIPYDLMTSEELGALGMTRQDAEIVENAELEGRP